MAWPTYLQCRKPNTVTRWGKTFEWTDQHISPAQYDPMKYTYDTLAEECLSKLDSISPPRSSTPPRQQSPTSDEKRAQPQDAKCPMSRDLYALLRDNAQSDPSLLQLWTEINTVPSWVDWDQIQRGQDVFYRYGGPNLVGLAYQSLLGGMGAARVTEVLARTGGFSTKVARRRLFETTQHILQCTRSLPSIQPTGEGFASSVRVRFLHAAVRNRIMLLSREKPAYYNVQAWGVPINDLDCIGTITSFSSSLIWFSLPSQGIWMQQQEIADYLALWRYIAYIMGCPADSFATPEKAKAVLESLLYYEVNPSETSKLMANNIVKSLADQPPAYNSAGLLIASARWLNGNELGDALGLERPNLYYSALVLGQCTFFMAITYFDRMFPSMERKRIDMLKKGLYAIIVESKFGLQGKASNFDFKYVPQFSTITELNMSKEQRPNMRGADLRNLKWFGIGVLVMLSFLYISYKVIALTVGLMWTATSSWR